MRRWIKYAAIPRDAQSGRAARSADDFFAQMGGYGVDESYQSPSAFFATHLQARPRLMAYDRYLQSRVRRGERILSVGSGRCVNELKLMETAQADIVCSDLQEPPCLDATRAIFPELKFIKLEVLKDKPPGLFDTVLSLGLIYAFDDAELLQFFNFVQRALKPNGRLLLDLAGAPDTFLSWLFHDVYLPAETAALARYLTLRIRKPHAVREMPHGYRRSVEDVSCIAREAGQILVDVHNDGFDLDFRRSVVLNPVARTAFGAKCLARLGRRMPYVRMASFVRMTP